MAKLFSIAHVAQLHEIQSARLKRGQSGIGLEVDELIRRLTSGGVAGKTDDIRLIQAKRLWDIGVGRALTSRFGTYLAAIPEIPAELAQDDADYPLLVLVDPRFGLKRLCELGDIEFSGDDQTFVEYDERHREFAEPTWVRVQDGRKNRNRTVRDCRASFGKDEVGLTALQGVCTYFQYPSAVTDTNLVNGHVMDLSGSVLCGRREDAACLLVWKGRVKLNCLFDDNVRPKQGSASRGECKVL